MMALLDKEYTWPAEYLFKFIVKADQLDILKKKVGGDGLSIKNSKKGKYTSLTIKKMMSSSLEVVDFYQKVYTIDGIITL